jgi:hypothetical protein
MFQSVIFGVGYHGRAVYRKIKIKSKNDICWVDNDKKKSFKSLFGSKIYPVSHLKKLKYKKIILSGRSIEEQITQYKKLDLDKKKIKIWDNLKLIPSKKLQIKREMSAEKILQNILFVLAKKKIFNWVDSSGILQVIRDKKISSLSDFDLSFYYKDHKKVLRSFQNHKLYDVVKTKIDSKKCKIFMRGKNNFKDYEPPVFDFQFNIVKKDFIYNAFNYKKKTPLNYLDSFIDYIFKNKFDVKIPKKYINYLEYLYGKNGWKHKVRFFKNPLAKKNRPLLGPIDR